MLESLKAAARGLARKVREEPVLVSQAMALVVSGLAAWGLPLTDAQELWAGGVAVLVAALVGRSQVKPMVKVGASEDEDGGLEAGPASDVPDGQMVDVVPAGEPKSVEDKIWDNSTASGPVKPPVDWPRQL